MDKKEMTPTERRSAAMKKAWSKRRAAGTHKTKKKGKWSKIARAKHSVRMKERYAAQQKEQGRTVYQKWEEHDRKESEMTIKDHIVIVTKHINIINRKLGG